jgi:hypothetical protein
MTAHSVTALLQRRDESAPTWHRDRQYRKASLFDRALRSDVQVAKPPGPAH